MRAIITGGSSGIGKECTQLLAENSAELTIIDVLKPDFKNARWIQADLTEFDQLHELEAKLEGCYDVLINSAGLPPRESLEYEILAVNFIALRQISEVVIPHLNAGASIINLASKAGSNWKDGVSQVKRLFEVRNNADLISFCQNENLDHIRAYDLSKEAVIVWTIASCEGLKKRDIRINSVSPAAIQTRILDDFVAAFGARASQMINRIGRPGTPQEVAEVILFLVSKKSEWVTGIDLPVDGGTSAVVYCNQFALQQLGYK